MRSSLRAAIGFVCAAIIVLFPATTWALEADQLALVVNGLHLLENLKLDDLAAKQVYEFAFVMQPLKAQGFTGSTVAPVAIR